MSKVFAVRCGECDTHASLGWDEENKEFVSMCNTCKTFTSLEALLEGKPKEDVKNEV